MEIPQRHQDFVKKIVELAKEHGVLTFSGSIMPFTIGRYGSADYDPWRERISFNWSLGRHGAPETIVIESTARVFISV